jgi:hypothetical protein
MSEYKPVYLDVCINEKCIQNPFKTLRLNKDIVLSECDFRYFFFFFFNNISIDNNYMCHSYCEVLKLFNLRRTHECRLMTTRVLVGKHTKK